MEIIPGLRGVDAVANESVVNPVLVNVRRGTAVECVHRGIVVEAAADGTLRYGLGDVARPILPRSLIKPLDAVALVSSGAAMAYGLGGKELALAASSHLGRPEHLALLNRWMTRIQVDPRDLCCGTHWPFERSVAHALAANRQCPSVIQNNNSGKHLALLTICRAAGFDIADYWRPEHPVQRVLMEVRSQFMTAAAGEMAIEACGLPTTTLRACDFATGLAAMTDGGNVPEPFRGAAWRILTAMASRPDLVTGTGKISTLICQTTAGRLVVKGGSEGGFAVIAPAGGFAIVIKIDDGAHRAAEVVLLEYLRRRGLLHADEYETVRASFDGAVNTYAGIAAGSIEFAAGAALH